jgi:uncharacterized repeat protein (TIGR01451 family)
VTRLRALILLLTLMLPAPAAAQVETLLTYDFDGRGSTNPSPAAISVTGIAPLGFLGNAPGLLAVGVTHRTHNNKFHTEQWPVGSSSGPDPNRYLTWGFTTDRGFILDEIWLQLNRDGSGPREFRLDVSIDGGAFQTVGSSATLGQNTNSLQKFTIDLADAEVRESAVFVLYAFGSTGSGGALIIEDAGSTPVQHGIVIRGEPMPAILEADKTFSIFSENGADCADLAAPPPGGTQPAAAIPGACIEYRLEVTNTGGRAAHDVDVVAMLPAVLTVQAAGRAGWDETAADGFALSFDCTAGGCSVTVENGIIPVSTTATVTFRATVD